MYTYIMLTLSGRERMLRKRAHYFQLMRKCRLRWKIIPLLETKQTKQLNQVAVAEWALIAVKCERAKRRTNVYPDVIWWDMCDLNKVSLISEWLREIGFFVLSFMVHFAWKKWPFQHLRKTFRLMPSCRETTREKSRGSSLSLNPWVLG